MSESPAEILIVDDSAQDAELVVAALMKRLPGVTTFVAKDGAEAITILEDLSALALPRVVLLDLKIPEASGCSDASKVMTSSARFP